jgi:hypothetical protein
VTKPGEERPQFGAVLTELSSARVPWLALARDLRTRSDATVVDLADPHVPPVTVNPFEPEAGYPVQAHADRLAGLFEAAFGLPGPVAAAVRAGLRRAYEDCGWDALTGGAPPGARAAPAVPAFGQLARAALAAAEDLGYDRRMRAAVAGFVHARLEPLWTGPAGRFLEGGHPADVAALVRGNVLLLLGDLADDDGVSFLAGALLARIAERLRLDDRREAARAGCSGSRNRRAPGWPEPPGPRLAVVLATGLVPETTARPRAAGWFGRLFGDIRSAGAQVITEPPAGYRPRPAARRTGPAGSSDADPEPPPASADPEPPPASADPESPPALAGPEPRPDEATTAGPAAACAPFLRGRRSAACGVRCRGGRPCSGYELHAAGLLARDDEQAWLRLWAQTLLLAFLAGRPLPRVPAEVLSVWRALSPPRRECVLATILDRPVTVRAPALRRSYDPAALTAAAAAVARRMLDEAAVPFRAGPVWVIPQLRWLHEIERLNPLGGAAIRLDDIAPPLDFGLAGLPDWPGIRVRDRLGALGRHPLSVASPRNRRLAGLALLGEDGRAGLDADLATAVLGVPPAARLPYAARLMGAGAHGPDPGWLEVVLSWPDRLIRPAWDTDLRPAADTALNPVADIDLRPGVTG